MRRSQGLASGTASTLWQQPKAGNSAYRRIGRGAQSMSECARLLVESVACHHEWPPMARRLTDRRPSFVVARSGPRGGRLIDTADQIFIVFPNVAFSVRCQRLLLALFGLKSKLPLLAQECVPLILQLTQHRFGGFAMDPSLGQTGPFTLRSLFQISECEPVRSSTEDVSVQIEAEISSGNDRIHSVLDRYGPVVERVGQKNGTAWNAFRLPCH